MYALHLFSLLLLFLHSLHTVANPNPNNKNNDNDWDGKDGHSPRPGCLTSHSASKLVSIFEQFLIHIDTKTADRFLTPDFEEISDSVNYVSPGNDLTPGAPSATSRAQFIQQQLTLQATPQPNFTTLAVYHTCDTVTFRWRLNFPTKVSGIDVLVVKPGSHLIQTDYSEFNTVGLLVNFGCRSTGGLCGACSA